MIGEERSTIHRIIHCVINVASARVNRLSSPDVLLARNFRRDGKG